MPATPRPAVTDERIQKFAAYRSPGTTGKSVVLVLPTLACAVPINWLALMTARLPVPALRGSGTWATRVFGVPTQPPLVRSKVERSPVNRLPDQGGDFMA